MLPTRSAWLLYWTRGHILPLMLYNEEMMAKERMERALSRACSHGLLRITRSEVILNKDLG